MSESEAFFFLFFFFFRHRHTALPSSGSEDNVGPRSLWFESPVVVHIGEEELRFSIKDLTNGEAFKKLAVCRIRPKLLTAPLFFITIFVSFLSFLFSGKNSG